MLSHCWLDDSKGSQSIEKPVLLVFSGTSEGIKPEKDRLNPGTSGKRPLRSS